MKAHCLFEQSGTFKNEFKKLGVEAYDYDILNDFGETDFQIDLFAEIAKSYEGGASVFDDFKQEDIVLAFFPCTMFQENNALLFAGTAFQQKQMSDKEKLNYCIDRHETLHLFYTMLCKLVVVAIEKGFRMVVENPATEPHYLNTYFPIRPAFTDKNRYENGDYYKKPTNYWFINFMPLNNLVFEPIDHVDIQNIKRQRAKGGKTRQVLRSMIHPQYANRFIRQYILPEEMWRKEK